MNTHVDFNDPEIQKLLEKVEKLLRLASNNPNEQEAASAAAKAQELLAVYQLDMSALEQSSGKNQGRREDKRLKGGLYKWQRDLWNHVAQLNFCLYWSIRGLKKGSTYEHRVIGRTANILGSKLMAEYLEQAIERITRDRYDSNPSLYFSKAGIAFREGMADRICERLRERRREQQEAERAKEAATPRPAGSTSTALTLVAVTKSEWDANQEFEYDLRHGPGAWAEAQRRHKEYWAEARRQTQEAEAAKAAWIEANPEEHARLEAEEQERRECQDREERKREERNARRRTGSTRTRKSDYVRHNDYFDGHKRGADVSLDQQIDNRKDRSLS